MPCIAATHLFEHRPLRISTSEIKGVAPPEVPADLYLRTAASQILAVLLMAAMTWAVMRIVGAVGEAVVRLHPAGVSDNLHARRIQTQTRFLTRTLKCFALVIGAAAALMTLPDLRQIGKTAS